MSKETIHIAPRMDMITTLIETVRDALVEVEDAYTAAELVSALLSLTASCSEIMLAMSDPDHYGYNLAQVLQGLKQLEERVNPKAIQQ